VCYFPIRTNVVVHHVWKPTDFLFNVLSGDCCSEYPATVALVEVDNIFDSFDGGKCVDPGKTLHCPLNDNSPHVHHTGQRQVWGYILGSSLRTVSLSFWTSFFTK
jgi:hypothetical protein